ncbi:peroxiredoxin-2B-like [Vicia villosa]|uniref:peroxiredoxin-2B-like n=1 Tax=Vicia villosa TaxID=3911 RepID=UPI00273CA787|nr:peroxiredoxin-2B-like [Vicia villosa]
MANNGYLITLISILNFQLQFQVLLQFIPSPITVGAAIPDGTSAYLDEENKPQSASIHSLSAAKKVIIFGVPGAFTRTCSLKHVPGFIERAEELKGKGVDEIICISVNDSFVMNAWAKTFPENNHVKFLADRSAKYTHSLGLELDLTEKGLGIRLRRFALLVEDLKVKVANVEGEGEFNISSAEEIIKAL